MPPSKILLARPHPFIMGAMADALTRAGLVPVSQSTGPLGALHDPDLVGAVISTAVVSSVTHGYAEVYASIREARPRLPVIFATLVESPRFARTLGVALARSGWPSEIMTLDAMQAGRTAVHPSEAVLLVDEAAMERSGDRVPTLLRAWLSGGDAIPLAADADLTGALTSATGARRS